MIPSHRRWRRPSVRSERSVCKKIMPMIKEFEIRSYGKSELAMLYFPKAQTVGGALSNLNYWIRRCTDLSAALRACGMARNAKSYTPKEVALIVYYLGEP